MKNKLTWDLSPLFVGDNDPEIKKRRIIDAEKGRLFIDKWEKRTDYLTDPMILKEALDDYELWRRETGAYDREAYYFDLRNQQEMSNPALKAALNQISDLSTKLENEIQFFILRVGQIPEKEQKRFLDNAGLKKYHHFLEFLFKEAKYRLSEPEEKILNLKRQTSHSNWVRMVSGFIADEQREVLLENGTRTIKGFSDLASLLSNQNKSVRDSAAAAVNEILGKYASLAEQEMNAILANKKVDDELRGFPRPDSGRHLSDDMETEVVDILLKTVAENFSISRRWYELKAKLLGIPRLAYHERVVEYGQINKSYSYQEASELVSLTFNKLDSEFGQIFDDFIKNGQIDALPRKGKHGGAFCAAGSISLPTYILLNHANKFNDVSTMAHEAGHGINNELMRKNLTSLDFGSPLSTAEVASTFMEDFVNVEVAKKADEELKLTMMVKKMDDEVATIFRQTACYLFEQELHRVFREKGYLAKEEIGKLFQKHMADYMGPAVEQSEGSENWWVYWSHIRSFFYVYSYVSGLLISKSLQNSVKKDSSFILQVKTFLAAGASDSPKNIFASLGIDITKADFWKTGLREIEEQLTETEKLAQKLGKI